MNRLFLPALAVVSVSLPASPARAQCQLSVTQALDGAAGDRFGWAIDLAQDRFVVGTISGKAYIFVRTGLAFEQETRLDPMGGTASAEYGRAVAISPSFAVVGDTLDDGGANGGAVYVFERSGTTWTQVQKLNGSDAMPGYRFGSAVDIAGDTIVVGANVGNAAYVFVNNGGTWMEQSKLIPSYMDAGLFGNAVSIDGESAIIGSPRDDNFPLPEGAAYVFTRSGSVWTEEERLTAPGQGQFLDEYGTNVSISGDIAVVARQNPGTTYLYERVGTNWGQAAVFAVPAGDAISISGTRVAIGFNADDTMGTNTGAALVFVRQMNGTWIERLRLFADEPAPLDRFGTSVQLTGTALVVSSPFRDDAGSNSGAVYVYSVLPLPDVDCNDNGQRDMCDLMTGASQDANGNGLPDDCEGPYCEGELNSTGAPATLVVSGDTDPLLNDLTLDVTGLPADQFGQFLMSPHASFVVGPGNSQGNLCLGLPIARFANDIQFSGPAGTVSFSPDLTDLPNGSSVSAGETWKFQFWYRDLNPHFTSNLSSASAFTFE
ncbi:MAG: hypothetical protein GY711_23795 [bacterium]|nr:hypothetical protein [bacterium]